MHGDAHPGEIVQATRLALAQVRAACESWRFPSNLNHAMATAGMARAADLIEDALYLAERPPSVGANILVRSAFECWLVGAWALFGGDDALIGIEKERARNERVLAYSNGLDDGAVGYLDDQLRDLKAVANELLGSEAPSSVKYEEMARALPARIREQPPDHEEVDVLAVYNLLYRSHSTYDAHPWKVLGQYITESGLGLRVKPTAPWQDPRISTALMTMYLGVLGRWIDRARGADGEDWDVAVARLEVLLRPT